MFGLPGPSDALPLALQVAKMLQDDLGAVVAEYGVGPDGSITVEVGVNPRAWQFRIARHRDWAARGAQFSSGVRAHVGRARAHHASVDMFLAGRRGVSAAANG